MLSRLTYANVTATLALFVALGGSSYAALKLPRNSVKATQIATGAVRAPEIARNAVRSPDVRDGSLRRQDFAPGQLPAGPAGAKGEPGAPGPQGERGPQGETGPAGADAVKFFAVVNADGTIVAQSGGISVVDSGAQYDFTLPADVRNCAAIVQIGGNHTLEFGFDGQAYARTRSAPNENKVRVVTQASDGTSDPNLPFHLAVFC